MQIIPFSFPEAKTAEKTANQDGYFESVYNPKLYISTLPMDRQNTWYLYPRQNIGPASPRADKMPRATF